MSHVSHHPAAVYGSTPLRWATRPESESPTLPWLVLTDLARAAGFPSAHYLVSRNSLLLRQGSRIDLPASYADLPTISKRTGELTGRTLLHVSLPFALTILTRRGDSAAFLADWLRQNAVNVFDYPLSLPTPSQALEITATARKGLWWTRINGVTVVRRDDHIYMRLSSLVTDVPIGNGIEAVRSMTLSRCTGYLRGATTVISIPDPSIKTAKRCAQFVSFPGVKYIVERLRSNVMKAALYRRARDIEMQACAMLGLPIRAEFGTHAETALESAQPDPVGIGAADYPAWVDRSGISQERWG